MGEVVASEDPHWLGRRVAGEINLACGQCEWCARGLGRHCPTRRVLQAHGAQLHLFERHKDKMRLVEKAGVTTALVSKKTPQRVYRWVVDATGLTEGLRTAVTMCEPRGTVIMKSTVHGPVDVDTAPVIVNEVTLLGSRCGRLNRQCTF